MTLMARSDNPAAWLNAGGEKKEGGGGVRERGSWERMGWDGENTPPTHLRAGRLEAGADAPPFGDHVAHDGVSLVQDVSLRRARAGRQARPRRQVPERHLGVRVEGPVRFTLQAAQRRGVRQGDDPGLHQAFGVQDVPHAGAVVGDGDIVERGQGRLRGAGGGGGRLRGRARRRGWARGAPRQTALGPRPRAGRVVRGQGSRHDGQSATRPCAFCLSRGRRRMKGV